MLGGMPEAEATFRDQHVIMRMKESKTILDAVLGICCTRCELMIMAWRHREG